MTQVNSTWYLAYVDSPSIDHKKFRKKFKNRFRCTWDSYVEILTEVKSCHLFQRWHGSDCSGEPSCRIELLLLGALRTLGRDAKCDDLEEYTAIDKETHRQFFHIFINYGSSILYSRHVTSPTTKEDLIPHMQNYARKGLHGAFGSMDATHIASKRIPHGLKQQHTGYKLPHTSRAYNMTVNNSGRILHNLWGPARWNDKTLIVHDALFNRVKSHDLGDDVVFELFYFDETTKKVCKQKYCGVWLLVDNGYHDYSCTIPPFKDVGMADQHAWSEWLESTRKDVECVFGILKARFLILTSPIRYHGVAVVDKIWKTCCALHNMILDAKRDDLARNDDDTDTDAGQESGSDDEEAGNNNAKDYLSLPDGDTMKYTTGVDLPADFSDDREFDDPTYRNGCGTVIPIKHLNMNTFRSRLVRHFAICKCNNLVHWKKIKTVVIRFDDMVIE